MAVPEVSEHRKPWAIYADELPDYWNPERVPSPSRIIAWKYGGPPDTPLVQIAQDRGAKGHLALQFYDEGDLDIESIAGTDLEGYLAAWLAWQGAETPKWLAIEKPLWGEICGVRYIVRPDRVVRTPKGVAVVDIKTKSAKARGPRQQEALNHALEVAAQSVAVEQRLGLSVSYRVCVYLYPDGRHEVRNYSDGRYIDQWGALVGEWAWGLQAAAVPQGELSAERARDLRAVGEPEERPGVLVGQVGRQAGGGLPRGQQAEPEGARLEDVHLPAEGRGGLA